MGGGRVDDGRLASRSKTQVTDQPAELRVLDRALPEREQHGVGPAAAGKRFPFLGHWQELQRQSFGRDHFLHPPEGTAPQILVAFRDPQILGDPVEQADFFIGGDEVHRKLLGLDLQLPDPCVGGRLLHHEPAHPLQGFRRPWRLAAGPSGRFGAFQAE